MASDCAGCAFATELRRLRRPPLALHLEPAPCSGAPDAAGCQRVAAASPPPRPRWRPPAPSSSSGSSSSSSSAASASASSAGDSAASAMRGSATAEPRRPRAGRPRPARPPPRPRFRDGVRVGRFGCSRSAVATSSSGAASDGDVNAHGGRQGVKPARRRRRHSRARSGLGFVDTLARLSLLELGEHRRVHGAICRRRNGRASRSELLARRLSAPLPQVCTSPLRHPKRRAVHQPQFHLLGINSHHAGDERCCDDGRGRPDDRQRQRPADERTACRREGGAELHLPGAGAGAGGRHAGRRYGAGRGAGELHADRHPGRPAQQQPRAQHGAGRMAAPAVGRRLRGGRLVADEEGAPPAPPPAARRARRAPTRPSLRHAARASAHLSRPLRSSAPRSSLATRRAWRW